MNQVHEAVTPRYLAFGRYLRSEARQPDVPALLRELAATATPVTAAGGLDPSPLESVERRRGERLVAANDIAN